MSVARLAFAFLRDCITEWDGDETDLAVALQDLPLDGILDAEESARTIGSVAEERARLVTQLWAQQSRSTFPPPELQGLDDRGTSTDALSLHRHDVVRTYQFIERACFDVLQKVACLPCEGGVTGAFFIAASVSQHRYRTIESLLGDLYSVVAYGEVQFAISAADARSVYRVLLAVWSGVQRDAELM
ncbi:hypothetical protein GMRT_12091 [Giardia muris]|uniref:Uncharacterized protein n=1 Tax=Giardia muris TaxID=5742 RepID=A0A4Z1SMV4_GIAMU|nr:hypothetical protein GMRT_12091 [Giardia muris]|eukprot:TNJ27044.1 hypothetical protein GMRT_12091 [Giardia muris]